MTMMMVVTGDVGNGLDEKICIALLNRDMHFFPFPPPSNEEELNRIPDQACIYMSGWTWQAFRALIPFFPCLFFLFVLRWRTGRAQRKACRGR
jgi:hypothetical protein